MIIIYDENSLNKESVAEMVELSNSESLTVMDVLKFWRKRGILMPSKETIEKLKEQYLK